MNTIKCDIPYTVSLEKFIEAHELELRRDYHASIAEYQKLCRAPYWRMMAMWRIAKVYNAMGFKDMALRMAEDIEEEISIFKQDISGGDDDAAGPLAPVK